MATLNTSTSTANTAGFFKGCGIVLHARGKVIIAGANLVDPFVDKTAELIGDMGNSLIKGVKALNAHRCYEVNERAEYEKLCSEIHGSILTFVDDDLALIANRIKTQEEMIKYLTQEEGDYEAKISACKDYIIRLTFSLKRHQRIRGELTDELNLQKKLIWANRNKSVEEIKEIIKDSNKEIECLYNVFITIALPTSLYGNPVDPPVVVIKTYVGDNATEVNDNGFIQAPCVSWGIVKSYSEANEVDSETFSALLKNASHFEVTRLTARVYHFFAMAKFEAKQRNFELNPYAEVVSSIFNSNTNLSYGGLLPSMVTTVSLSQAKEDGVVSKTKVTTVDSLSNTQTSSSNEDSQQGSNLPEVKQLTKAESEELLADIAGLLSANFDTLKECTEIIGKHDKDKYRKLLNPVITLLNFVMYFQYNSFFALKDYKENRDEILLGKANYDKIIALAKQLQDSSCKCKKEVIVKENKEDTEINEIAKFEGLCREIQGRTLIHLNETITARSNYIAVIEGNIKQLTNKNEGDYSQLITKQEELALKLTVAVIDAECIMESIATIFSMQKDIIWTNRSKSVDELKDLLKDSIAEVKTLSQKAYDILLLK